MDRIHARHFLRVQMAAAFSFSLAFWPHIALPKFVPTDYINSPSSSPNKNQIELDTGWLEPVDLGSWILVWYLITFFDFFIGSGLYKATDFLQKSIGNYVCNIADERADVN